MELNMWIVDLLTYENVSLSDETFGADTNSYLIPSTYLTTEPLIAQPSVCVCDLPCQEGFECDATHGSGNSDYLKTAQAFSDHEMLHQSLSVSYSATKHSEFLCWGTNVCCTWFSVRNQMHVQLQAFGKGESVSVSYKCAAFSLRH